MFKNLIEKKYNGHELSQTDLITYAKNGDWQNQHSFKQCTMINLFFFGINGTNFHNKILVIKHRIRNIQSN